MKINWNQNPLKTTVELDEHEKKEFWYKIKIKMLKEKIYEANFYLKEQYLNIDKANVAVDTSCFYDENGENSKDSKLDLKVDQKFEDYVEELQGIHVGDCTCIPCTCMKCLAEMILGIDTIEGLRKHEAHYIDSAFEKLDNIDEVIEYLKNYDADRIADNDSKSWKHKNPELWASSVPRWNKEAREAAKWLTKYKEEHNF